MQIYISHIIASTKIDSSNIYKLLDGYLRIKNFAYILFKGSKLII